MKKYNTYRQLITLCLLAISMVLPFMSSGAIQLTSPASLRLMATGGSNNVQFGLTVTPPNGYTVSQVYAVINGVMHNASAPTGNVYPVSWTTPGYGSYPFKGYVVYTNGVKDSTTAINYKVIQSSVCGIAVYNNTTGYVLNDTVVTGTDSVYRRNTYWGAGDYPTISNIDWIFLGKCNSSLYANYDCSTMQSWAGTTVYGTPNTYVTYNGLVYANNYWIQTEAPDTSSAWKLKGACIVPNSLPAINTTYANDTTLVMNPITALTIPVSITDFDGSIASTTFTINGVAQTPTVSGSIYTLHYTPSGYGDYSLHVAATDDENGTTTVNSIIHIMPSVPPTVTAIYPVNSQVISMVSSIGSTAVTLSAMATGNANAVTGVTFSINGGTPFSTTAAGNTYTASWTPAAYGSYTLTIKATDAGNAYATKTVNFTLENPTTQTVAFSALPLQLTMNLGNTKTFTLDSSIQSVMIRNTSLAKVSISGNQLVVTGYRTGRSGLKITTAGGSVYYVGLRVNANDGTAPSLPPYASIGFVSEDSPTDIGFWQKMDTTLTNKNMDVRYIYINDGPIGTCNGCNTWRDSTRHMNYCKNSLKYGITPFFVYYNIPNAGESFTTDLMHAQDTAYMRAYFNDLATFLKQCHEIMGDDLFGIVLEPDFLGYMQQLGVINAGTSNPDSIITCVTANNIAYNSGTIHTLVDRINQTVADSRSQGSNLYFGWQMDLWSDPTTAGGNGIMRSTDATNLGWDAGRQNVINGATNVANYLVSAGVLSHGADFISMDKYGLDAGAFNASYAWWFNSDHWNNYMLYAKTVHEISGKPMVLWQLPIGHINNTTYTSAYTGQVFPPLPNTTAKYEDPTTTYFFGDKFVVADDTKRSYLLQNNANDTGVHDLGNDTLQWAGHINDFINSGIVHAMFGAGVGTSTNGIHDNSCDTCGPTDQYWSIQKIQQYYDSSITWVDTSIFMSNILYYTKTDSNTESLRVPLGNSTYMYYGYNGVVVSDTGAFIPSHLKGGMNYVSVVSNAGQSADWKVQRIMIVDTLPPLQTITSIAKNITLQVSPNPANGVCTVFISGNNTNAYGMLQLQSVDGRVLQDYEMTGSKKVINLATLASGIYLLRYQSDGFTKTVKIVKQ